MNTAWSGHVSISLAKPHDTSIAGATQEQQVSTVRLGIVARLDSLIGFFLPAHGHFLPPFGIPNLQKIRVGDERVPDFNKQRETV